jgi:hypothetical protein
MRETISKKSLKRGRVAADHATTGVSAGHDKGFNKVEPSTTSPDKIAPPAPKSRSPKGSAER